MHEGNHTQAPADQGVTGELRVRRHTARSRYPTSRKRSEIQGTRRENGVGFPPETFRGALWSNCGRRYFSRGIHEAFPFSVRWCCFTRVLAGRGFCGESAAAQTSVQAPPILPQEFGGWEMQGSAQTSTDPAAADPTNAAVLKEYRFTDFASATYTRDDGRTLKIRAARFADASGAFGAYTFYLQPEMTERAGRRSGRVAGAARSVLSRARAGGCAVQPAVGYVGGGVARVGRRIAAAERSGGQSAGIHRVHAAARLHREHAEIRDGTGGAGGAGGAGFRGSGGFRRQFRSVSWVVTAPTAGKRR